MKGEAKTTVPAALLLANAATIATLVPVVLHQIGVLAHLPDPPSHLFDSDRITESRAAHPLGIPDGLLGIGSFGLTLGLAIAARSHPAARKYLALKLAGDTGIAGVNVVRQVVSFRRLCSWCTATAVCAFVAAAAGSPILREQWKIAVSASTARNNARTDD